MSKKTKEKNLPPEVGPYVFPTLLAAFGLWCIYDGWITSDPAMQKHQLFNRVTGVLLLLWSIIDFIKTRKAEKAFSSEVATKERVTEDDLKP